MAKIVFPSSFKFKPHSVVPGAKQWIYKSDEDIFISIVGGGFISDIYGDGEKTFELYDNRLEDVLEYKTKEEINEYLDEEYN